MALSQYNKFLIALTMAGLSFAKSYFNIDIGVDEVTAGNLIAALTAILVYMVPNAPKADK
jgi:hypothetical protein